MTSQHDKPKWWRPKFSIRTLVVAVTLVCAYFGCWEATKTWGIPAVPEHLRLGPLTSPCPFVIVKQESWVRPNSNVYNLGGYDRRYYFWFFGYVVKLPFERELPVANPTPLDDLIRKLKAEVSDSGWVHASDDTGEILVWPYDLR